MSEYSFQGYLSALEMRTTKTLLVEGPTDIQILSRILNGLEEAGTVERDTVVIDSADLIQRSGLQMGIRQFVEHVHAASTAQPEKFFVLVDREFRGFELGPPLTDPIGTHYLPAPNCMWTRGHSIENYMLTPEPFIEFLRHHYPESIPVNAYADIERNVSAAVVWSAAVSLALLEAQAIGRSEGVCQTEHWDCVHRYLNAKEYAATLAPRCGATFDSASFTSRVVHWYSELSQVSVELPRWIAHGHISTSMVWVVVGKTLDSLGVDAAVVDQVAKGMKTNKLRIAATWWQQYLASNPPDSPTPLIEWLISVPSAA